MTVAQRLVRKLCEACKQLRDDISLQQRTALGFSEEVRLYAAKGCASCTQGYQGRIGLFEMAEQANSSLYASGLARVKQGITTLEELTRVVTA